MNNRVTWILHMRKRSRRKIAIGEIWGQCGMVADHESGYGLTLERWEWYAQLLEKWMLVLHKYSNLQHQVVLKSSAKPIWYCYGPGRRVVDRSE
jgi:hypothetical protein